MSYKAWAEDVTVALEDEGEFEPLEIYDSCSALLKTWAEMLPLLETLKAKQSLIERLPTARIVYDALNGGIYGVNTHPAFAGNVMGNVYDMLKAVQAGIEVVTQLKAIFKENL